MSLFHVEIDTAEFGRAAIALRAARKDAPAALAWGLNAVGRKAATRMRRVLVKQTGLKYGVFVRALRTKSATASNPEFRIESRGGDVALKFFSPRETRPGVTANPWAKRVLYPSTFLKGGRFPNRVPLKLGGGVFVRRFPKGRKIREERSGLFIPDEMLKGQSRAEFDKVTSVDLADATNRALIAILSGVKVSSRTFR